MRIRVAEHLALSFNTECIITLTFIVSTKDQ